MVTINWEVYKKMGDEGNKTGYSTKRMGRELVGGVPTIPYRRV